MRKYRQNEVVRKLMDAKTSGWNFDERQNIFISSHYLPINYLFFTKEEKCILKEMKNGSCHLNQVIKVNITNIGRNWHHGPAKIIPQSPNLLMRKQQTNPNLVTFYKTVLWKNVKINKDSPPPTHTQNQRSYFRLKETKEAW